MRPYSPLEWAMIVEWALWTAVKVKVNVKVKLKLKLKVKVTGLFLQ